MRIGRILEPIMIAQGKFGCSADRERGGWKNTFGGEVACEVAGEEDEGMKY